MKKLLTLLLSVLMILSLAACSSKTETEEPKVEETVETVDYAAKSEGVMTYEEYKAVPADGSTEVVVEGYVQAVQSYWNGAVLYLQDTDGAYFVYNDGNTANISEEDYATLVDSTDYSNGWTGLANGTKVKVTGTKTEWAGEVEIVDSTVELVNDGLTWKAEAEDLTSLFGASELADHVNEFVTFKGLTVAPSTDAEGNEVAFLYNWDGSGSEGSDLYFYLTNGTDTIQFTVESYLMYAGSPVYEAVKGLNVGDTVDVEAFLYWYNGANPHTVSVTVK